MSDRQRERIRYSFEREPSPKRFVAHRNGERVEQTVGEGESLSAALATLRGKAGEREALDATECAFQAGYMVGVWDARHSRTHDSIR